MVKVEVTKAGDVDPLFVVEFGFLPRVGESVSIRARGDDDVYDIYRVRDVYHFADPRTDTYRAGIVVELDD
ncbi:MAG: hypothetical protein LH465_08395 [Sphingomonas bacterium]|nr:hypothetical protein [Sphingomonas bacterium]